MKIKVITLFLFYFLIGNISLMANDSTFQLKKYTPFYPIGIRFNNHSFNLSKLDSLIIKNFVDYIIDSTNFLNYGYFTIQIASEQAEVDSNSCIDFERITSIKSCLLYYFRRKDKDSSRYIPIYSNTFKDDEHGTSNKNAYQPSLGVINLHLNYGADVKKLFKDR